MEIFYTILGLVGIYSIIHFFTIQFMKNWSNRNAYEKFVTILAITFITLLIMGIISGGASNTEAV